MPGSLGTSFQGFDEIGTSASYSRAVSSGFLAVDQCHQPDRTSVSRDLQRANMVNVSTAPKRRAPPDRSVKPEVNGVVAGKGEQAAASACWLGCSWLCRLFLPGVFVRQPRSLHTGDGALLSGASDDG
jgi:hypothetical protein